MTKKCTIWWCDKPHYANGYCKAHDTANKRYGSPYGRRKEQFIRIEDEILKARLIAIRLTEFVATEFGQTEFEPKFSEDQRVLTWNTYEIPRAAKCPFCYETGGHKLLCAVKLSESLLEKTRG